MTAQEFPNRSTDPRVSSSEFVFVPKQRSILGMRGIMSTLTLNEVYTLLGTRHILGSEKELNILCIRITELMRQNGKRWVENNRRRLLAEWEFIVTHEIIT
jgi:hypothetical protein